MLQTIEPESRFLLLFVLVATPTFVSCEDPGNVTSEIRPTEVSFNVTTSHRGIGTQPGPSTPVTRPPQTRENGTLGDLHLVNETTPNGTQVSPTGTQSLIPSTRTTMGSGSSTLPIDVRPGSTSGAPEVRSTLRPTTPKPTVKATEAPPCPESESSPSGLVGPCLITIAVLAAVAIAFVVSTVVLATKLAGARHRLKAGLLLDDTEMVCISALASDSEHPMARPKHPKSNGALIPLVDCDEDDALTLNSFLPDTDSVP